MRQQSTEPSITVPTSTWEAGTYKWVVSAALYSTEGNLLSITTSECSTTLKLQDIIVSIQGGDRKVILDGTELSLNATNTIDPEKLNRLDHLSFVWSCKADVGYCQFMSGIAITNPILRIAKSQMLEGVTYSITLTVSHLSTGRTSSKKVQIWTAATGAGNNTPRNQKKKNCVAFFFLWSNTKF